jgi:hypothetical protein
LCQLERFCNITKIANNDFAEPFQYDLRLVIEIEGVEFSLNGVKQIVFAGFAVCSIGFKDRGKIEEMVNG